MSPIFWRVPRIKILLMMYPVEAQKASPCPSSSEKCLFVALPEESFLWTGPGSAAVPTRPQRAPAYQGWEYPCSGTYHSVEFHIAHYAGYLIELLGGHGEQVVCGLKSRRVTGKGRKERKMLTPHERPAADSRHFIFCL